jgi:hypothetical protein
MEQNGCVVADYPLLPADDPVGQRYLGYQRAHRCALVYGAPVNSDWENERQQLLDPTRSETLDALIARGVRYITIHNQMYDDPAQVKKYPVEYSHGMAPKINDSRLSLISCEAGHCLYELP